MAKQALVKRMSDQEREAIAASIDTKWLLQEFNQRLNNIVHEFEHAAACYQRLCELGHEVRVTCPQSTRRVMKRVAQGVLKVELVGQLYLSEHDRLFRRAMTLCPQDQQRVIDNQPIEVAEPGTDDHRMVRPLEMTDKEIDQVFHKGEIQGLEGQRKWFRDQQRKAASKASADDAERFYFTKKGKRKILHINPATVSADIDWEEMLYHASKV